MRKMPIQYSGRHKISFFNNVLHRIITENQCQSWPGFGRKLTPVSAYFRGIGMGAPPSPPIPTPALPLKGREIAFGWTHC